MGEKRVPAGLLHLLLLAILLFAFAARIYRLDASSMWSDEGLSLYRAQLPLAEVFENTITVDGIDTRDTNPPLYFLLLNLWRRAAGDSVFALRYFGVLAGVLAVPLLYLLGRLVYNRPLGLVAAALLALSPFAVWMSQELRNYGLLLSLNLLTVYGLFRFLLGDGRRRWLILWVTAGLLGAYTHYFGFFILAYSGVALVAFLVWRRWRPPLPLLIAGGVLLLALLPILPVALERFRAGRQVDFDFLPPTAVLRQALNAYAVGISASLQQPAGRVWPVVLLALAGVGLLLWRRRGAALTLTAGYLVLPLAVLLLLSQINPLYNGPRHVFIGLPPFLLLVGMGLVGWSGRWRILPLLGGLFLLASQGQWLWTQHHDPALARDDVRGAALYLNEFATAQDVIVLHDTLIRFTFEHYYNGPAPVVSVPPLWQQDVPAAIQTLQEAAAPAERVWFLVQPTPRTGFPLDTLWEWADDNWPRFADLDFAGLWLRVHLNGYRPDPAVSELPPEATPYDIDFGPSDGPAIALHGLSMPREVTAGDTTWPLFNLSSQQPQLGHYTFSLRFVDETGQTWEQADGLLWRRYPPASWPAGVLLRYDHELIVPAGLPPGSYDLWLRVLDPNLQPLPASTGGVDAPIGKVTVQASHDPAELPKFDSQRARLGPITLLGYRLGALEARPGHLLPLDVFWQVRQTPNADYVLRAQLLDPAGNVISEATTTPSRAAYPTSAWQPSELLRGQIGLPIPGIAQPGPHRLTLALLDPVTDRTIGRPVTLSQELTIVAWPLETEFPPIATPLRADFGQPPLAELHGYGLPAGDIRPGDTFTLTLFWRAVAESIPINYTVFVHLTGEDGQIAAQGDTPPVYGVRPTSGWRPGEVLVDEHTINVPDTVPPGRYQLWVGLYEPDSFVRPPAVQNGEVQPDGRILLQEVIITP